MNTYPAAVRQTRIEGAPAPGSEPWTRNVSASKIPALLGLSPWASAYSLWAEATGAVPAPATTPQQQKRYQTGHIMEPHLLAYLQDTLRAADHDVRVRAGFDVQHPQHANWTAAPDGYVYEGRRRTPFAGVECKTAQYADGWGQEWTANIPPTYLAQCAWQMECTGLRRVYVPALVGMEFRVHVVEWEDVSDVVEEALEVAAQWCADVEQRVPPALDYHPRTLDTVRAEHPDIDRGEVAVLQQDIADGLRTAHQDQKAAEDRLNLYKSRALAAAGSAHILTDEFGVEVGRRQGRAGSTPWLKIKK